MLKKKKEMGMSPFAQVFKEITEFVMIDKQKDGPCDTFFRDVVHAKIKK